MQPGKYDGPFSSSVIEHEARAFLNKPMSNAVQSAEVMKDGLHYSL
jgi:hypothetical protein